MPKNFGIRAWVILSIATLSLSSLANAGTIKTTKPKKQAPKIDLDEGAEGDTGKGAEGDTGKGVVEKKHTTSAQNRKNKKATVAVEIIGFTMTPVIGLKGSWFLSPKTQLSLEYASSYVSDLGIGKKNIVEIKAKRFLSNSFYIDGGLGVEMWKFHDYGSTFGTSTEEVVALRNVDTSFSGSLTNIGAIILIGNQWQWSTFTLGCDWVGYFASLVTKFSFSETSNADDTEIAEEESRIRKNFGSSNSHLLRFYLGWSF